MKCPTDIMWSNYVEGESPADQEETLARHLEECPACAARCQELSDMRAVLKDALGDKPRRRLALPAASRWLLPLAAALLICILRLMSMDLTTPNAPPNVPAVPGPGESWSYRKVDSDLGLPVLRLIGRMAIQAPGEAVWRPAVAGERLPWGGRVRVATDSLVELGYRRSRIRLAGGSRMGLTGSTSDPGLRVDRGRVVVRLASSDGELPIVTPAGSTEVRGVVAVEVPRESFATVRVESGLARLAAGGHIGPNHEGLIGEVPTDWLNDLPRAKAARYRSLATVTALMLGNAPIAAWQNPLTAPRQRSESSVGMLVARDQRGREAKPLTISDYRVTVRIAGNVALTRIEESFYNSTDRVLEGTFYFPLPSGASISRFAMVVDSGELVEGEVVERRRARAIFESILRAQRDPALLEWMAGNTFKTRIFPIQPRSEKKIILEYTQLLPAYYGRVRYRYPLVSEMTRHSPIGNFELSIDLEAGMPLSGLSCPSLPDATVRRSPDGRGAKIRWRATELTPDRDVLLSYDRPTSGASLVVFGETDPRYEKEDGYFALSLAPKLRPSQGSVYRAGATVFLVDSSASIEPGDLARQLEALQMLIGELNSTDQVAILAVDVTPRDLTDGLVRSDGGSVRAALRELATTPALGATDLDAALRRGLQLLTATPASTPRRLIYLGDGVASYGQIDQASLLETHGEAYSAAGVRLHALASGRSIDRLLLEGLAQRTGGAFLALETDEQSKDALYGFALALGEQLLSNAQVRISGAETRHVYPRQLGSILPGQEVFVMGRIKSRRRLSATLSGGIGGKAVTRRYDLSAPEQRPEHLALGRFWARARIDALLGGKQDAKAAQEILALSRTWTLITPYTSFLVLESASEYARYDIDRTVRRRYWKGQQQPQQKVEPVVRRVPVGEWYYDPFCGRKRRAMPTQRSARVPVALLALNPGEGGRPARGGGKLNKASTRSSSILPDSAQDERREVGSRLNELAEQLVNRVQRQPQDSRFAQAGPSAPSPQKVGETSRLGGRAQAYAGRGGGVSGGKLGSETQDHGLMGAEMHYRRALLHSRKGDHAAALRDFQLAMDATRVNFRIAGAPGAFYRLGPSSELWQTFGIRIPVQDELDRHLFDGHRRDPLGHLLRYHEQTAAPAAVKVARAFQRLLASRGLPGRISLTLRRDDGRPITIRKTPDGLTLMSGGVTLIQRRAQSLALYRDWGLALQGVPLADSMTRMIQGVLPLMLDSPGDLSRRFEVLAEEQNLLRLKDRRNTACELTVRINGETGLVDRIEVYRAKGLAYTLERSNLQQLGSLRYYGTTQVRDSSGRLIGRTVVESATTEFEVLDPRAELARFEGLVRRFPLGDLAQHQGKSASAAFHRGLIHLREGAQPKALNEFSRAVRSEPDNAVLRFYRAFCAIGRAASKSERAEMVDVMGGDLARMLQTGRPQLVRLARLVFVQGSWFVSPQERLQAYKRVQRRSWRDWRAQAYLAWRSGKLAEAVRCQQQAVDGLAQQAAMRKLASAELVLYLGLAKKNKAAGQLLKRLRAGAKGQTGQLAALGWIAHRIGEREMSATLYRQALDVLEGQPLYAERGRLYLNLSVALEGEAAYQALLEGYHQLAEKSFSTGYGLLQRLVLLLGRESDVGRLSALRKGIAQGRLRSLVTRRLASVTKQPEEAARWWTEAYQESGRDGRLLPLLARALLGAKQYRRVTTLLEKQLVRGTGARWMHGSLQASYAKDGGPAWRINRLRTTAIERHPRDAGPRRAYAAILEARGQFDEAIREYRLAASFRPEDAKSLRDILRVAGKRGDLAAREWAALRMLQGTWLSGDGDVWGQAEKELLELVALHEKRGNRTKGAEIRRRIKQLKVKTLVVQMRWDSKTDVDLHVVEPGNHQVSYQSRSSFRGGVLDHDDTDGYGPETYTLKYGAPGTYKLSVKLYSSHSHKGPTRVTITIWRNKGGENETRQVLVKVLTQAKQSEALPPITLKKSR